MSRSVLLVEPDVDALGALASELRSRGLTVALADAADGAIERARSNRPDAVLLSSALGDVEAVVGLFQGDRELSGLPRFVLVACTPCRCARRRSRRIAVISAEI
jgi:CheY-like chemotaxis protein